MPLRPCWQLPPSWKIRTITTIRMVSTKYFAPTGNPGDSDDEVGYSVSRNGTSFPGTVPLLLFRFHLAYFYGSYPIIQPEKWCFYEPDPKLVKHNTYGKYDQDDPYSMEHQIV